MTTKGNPQSTPGTIYYVGSPAGNITAPEGSICFDITAAPYIQYVYLGAAWQLVGTSAAGVVAPGSNKQIVFNDGGVLGASAYFTFDKTVWHAALGNNSTIDVVNAPNDFAGAGPSLIVLQEAISGNLTNQVNYGASNFSTYSHTGVGSFAELNAITLVPQIIAASTGAVGIFEGAQINLINDGAGTISNVIGCEIAFDNSGGGVVTNNKGLVIDTPSDSGAKVVNNYGIFINAQAAIGTSLSYNIFSSGVTSKNYFQSGIQVANAAKLLESTVAMTSGAAGFLGTLTNAPKAGDPHVWIPITLNGVPGWVPWWHA